jgi:putative FmdB family regulatory protein
MTYNYHCKSCDHGFEKNIPIADRDKPIKEKCPLCGKKGIIDRVFEAPRISYDGVVSDIKRAGSGWNDVLKRAAKYAGKKSQVDHY